MIYNFYYCPLWYIVYKVPGLTPGRGQNIYNCDYNQPPPAGQVCDVDIKNWNPCTKENNYNYHKSAPCVFLKLNKIFGWIPEFYNNSNELPDAMPKSLQNYIKNVEKTDSHKVFIVLMEGEGKRGEILIFLSLIIIIIINL